MLKVRMHEHVCHELVEMEVRRHEEMESQHVVQVNAFHLEHQKCQEHQRVYNQ